MYRSSRASAKSPPRQRTAPSASRIYPAATHSRASSNNENSPQNTAALALPIKTTVYTSSTASTSNASTASTRPNTRQKTKPKPVPSGSVVQDSSRRTASIRTARPAIPRQMKQHPQSLHQQTTTAQCSTENTHSLLQVSVANAALESQAARRKELHEWKAKRDLQKIAITKKTMTDTVKPFIVPPRQPSPKPQVSVVRNASKVDTDAKNLTPSTLARPSRIPRSVARSNSVPSLGVSRIPRHSRISSSSESSCPPLLVNEPHSQVGFSLDPQTQYLSLAPAPHSSASIHKGSDIFLEDQYLASDRLSADMDKVKQTPHRNELYSPKAVLETATRRAINVPLSYNNPSNNSSNTFLNMSTALDLLKRIGVFRPFNRARVNVQVSDSLGFTLCKYTVNLPTFNFFRLENALSAMHGGQHDVARAIFQIIASSSARADETVKTFLGNGKWCIDKQHPTSTARFWIEWANLEELCGNRMAVLDIFDRGDESITKSSERDALRTELHTYILRSSEELGSSADDHARNAMDFDDDLPIPVPMITDLSELTPRPKHSAQSRSSHFSFTLASRTLGSSVLCNSYSDPQRVSITPRARQAPIRLPISTKKTHGLANTREMGDLVGMLDHLTLSTTALKQTNPIGAVCTKTPRSSKVVDSLSDGGAGDLKGSMTILTPVRANRKDRKSLGVDQVITPVRRSVRNFKDSMIRASSSTQDLMEEEEVGETLDKGTPIEDTHNNSTSGALSIKLELKALQNGSVAKLMDKFGYAFVPNKALLGGQKIPTSVARRNWAYLKDTNTKINRIATDSIDELAHERSDLS
ncbi:hypothetical protein BASA60_004175 [Batrachochytrium salamandrivorans]|nr:hypothetical protein BASA60_004175 [Batrachochytrium salamandrivorans]